MAVAVVVVGCSSVAVQWLLLVRLPGWFSRFCSGSSGFCLGADCSFSLGAVLAATEPRHDSANPSGDALSTLLYY